MTRVCLLTAGQPSTDPRLVKEADALVEAGYSVHVIAAYWSAWAVEGDRQLLSSRSWTCEFVGGDPHRSRPVYLATRIRYRAGRALQSLSASSPPPLWMVARVAPTLRARAMRTPADMFIAHGVAALPAAAAAARHFRAKAGYDAEDFAPGMRAFAEPMSPDDPIVRIEARYLPACDYVTASSPGISCAYERTYGIPRPTTILNVFPRCQRPRTRSERCEGPISVYWFSQTIGPDRGLEDAVRAVGLLGRQDVRVILRGSCQVGYDTHLYALAAHAGLHPEQLSCENPAPSDDMVRLSADHDIGLALEPGWGRNNQLALSNKIFTYLLAGNALVGTATPGQAPLLESLGTAAEMYHPGDLEALAVRLRHYIDNGNALMQARHRAWEWGDRVYNWDVEKEKFLSVVGRVLGTKARLRA